MSADVSRTTLPPQLSGWMDSLPGNMSLVERSGDAVLRNAGPWTPTGTDPSAIRLWPGCQLGVAPNRQQR